MVEYESWLPVPCKTLMPRPKIQEPLMAQSEIIQTDDEDQVEEPLTATANYDSQQGTTTGYNTDSSRTTTQLEGSAKKTETLPPWTDQVTIRQGHDAWVLFSYLLIIRGYRCMRQRLSRRSTWRFPPPSDMFYAPNLALGDWSSGPVSELSFVSLYTS